MVRGRSRNRARGRDRVRGRARGRARAKASLPIADGASVTPLLTSAACWG